MSCLENLNLKKEEEEISDKALSKKKKKKLNFLKRNIR